MFLLDPRHHYVVRCTLLIALLVAAALCACGKKDDHAAGGSQHADNEDEDPCDPSEPKVCVGNSVTSCEKNGHIGRRLRTCKDGCRDGRCVGACADEANKLIYLVDSSNNFISFDPRKLPGDPFKLIGQLDCPTGGYTPFSMSVDREGIAWVVYQSGDLMKVSITDAKCKASGFVPGSTGSRTFGMGFVTDSAGGKTEKLYTANDDGSHSLAWIDTNKQPPMAHAVGPITSRYDRNPELTGTSEGKLFGFYPNEFEPAFVQEIDKTTGVGTGTKWNLGDQGLGRVDAWAFAQWGGVFYIFVTTNGTPTVRSVDRKTGEYHVVMDMSPYKVTGAGVSTCAPELDKGQQATP